MKWWEIRRLCRHLDTVTGQWRGLIRSTKAPESQPAGDFLFVYYESEYPVCQRTGVYRVSIAGAFTAIGGGITVGQLSCFLSYANQYTKPFNEISSVVTELQNALACARRVFDFIEEQPEEPDAASAIELKNPDGSMTLEHVSFLIIRRLSFYRI